VWRAVRVHHVLKVGPAVEWGQAVEGGRHTGDARLVRHGVSAVGCSAAGGKSLLGWIGLVAELCSAAPATHLHHVPSTSPTRQSGRMFSAGGASRAFSLRIMPSHSACTAGGQGGSTSEGGEHEGQGRRTAADSRYAGVA
jgi:hypothetical protein